MMAGGLRFKRVLLKVSGEALLGSQSFGIDTAMVDRIAGEVGEAVGLGVEVGLVIGGDYDAKKRRHIVLTASLGPCQLFAHLKRASNLLGHVSGW